ncbi:MAG: nucleotidyl transferase AbiEii/AbiGii toxin family protein [Gemmatimonadota bacterium]|nr:nucleotidyl transferase AbiEii/AbiGii toxin family protein [Gemmatimonadota bacterium]
MAEIDLPRGPRELLEAVREPLGYHLGGEHHITLGGGTALAARWAHRHSTDVDLFVDHDILVRLPASGFRDDLARHIDGHAYLTFHLGLTRIVLPAGEITVDSSYSITTRPRSVDTVRGTRIGVHTNAEILARKLGYRILGESAFLSRDLYDLAVARHQDPAALSTAFDTVHPPNLFIIQRGLSELDQATVVRDTRSLLHPAHPGEAADFLAMVQRLVEREIDRRNPPTR